MNKTLPALFLAMFIIPSFCFAGIKFDNLNINSENKMLYTVTQNTSGIKPYSVLFSYNLHDESSIAQNNLPDIITCYPEYLNSLNKGKKMQVRNRYGTAVYDFDNNTLNWIARSAILPEKSFSLSPIITSPDGTWIVFMRKVASSTGELIIQNADTKMYVILDREASYSYTNLPVKWSPDSKNFVYQKNNSVYYCNPEKMFKGIQLEEKYRRIGNGKIQNVQWCSNTNLAYIDSDIIYMIDERELSSLGIYSNFYDLGKVIGRLPEHFDPDTMEFKINSAATQMVMVKNNNFVSYYNINSVNTTDYVKLLNYKSYTDVFDGSYKFEILWPELSKPVIWTDFISDSGKTSSAVYLFNEKNEIVNILSVEDSTSNAAISPDGKFISFSSGNSVFIYSVNPWSRIAEIKGEKTASLCWKDSSNLCIGGDQTVRLYNVPLKSENYLFLSQCKSATWDKLSKKIIALTDSYEEYFVYDEVKNVWQKIHSCEPLKAQVQNQDYRIYKAEAKNARYDNGIYVRHLSGKVNTFALYKEAMKKSAPKKKIALAFDLMNSADGVNTILALCEKYDIKPTFFINGEFIRRYPKEVKKIASSGAEAASMFYTCTDLTVKDFEINQDYIKRGLARNEDEYFAITGKELSLLWHAPFYKSNKMIRDAGSQAGYSYIEFPVEEDSIDSKAGKTLESQIIPITVGVKSDSEKNEFYTKLELLINSLMDGDYEIVSVSGL